MHAALLDEEISFSPPTTSKAAPPHPTVQVIQGHARRSHKCSLTLILSGSASVGNSDENPRPVTAAAHRFIDRKSAKKIFFLKFKIFEGNWDVDCSRLRSLCSPVWEFQRVQISY